MLPPENRITRKIFTSLPRGKKRIFSAEDFNMAVYPNGLDCPRFAIVISSSAVSKATARNRLKRKIRGLLLEQVEHFRGGFDVVLYFNKTASDKNFSVIGVELLKIFRQANLLNK